MRVGQSSALDFIGQRDVIFSIPLFQRPYSWNLLQCDTLWRDIVRAAHSGSSHFLGIILCKAYDLAETFDGSLDADAVRYEELSVIDGQQRLLTLFLLISAFAEYADERHESIDGTDGDELLRRYLKTSLSISISTSEKNGLASYGVTISGEGDDEESWKIIPSMKDRVPYLAALDEDVSGRAPINPKQIKAKATRNDRPVNAKAFFLQKMRESELEAKTVWRGIEMLTIVPARLDAQDDAQAIFESFNSRGVALVTADLVRNYLLMAEDTDTQVRLYEEYWEPLQGMFGDDPGSLRLNGAIRAWTTIRCKDARAVSDREAFDAFKRYCQNDFDGGVEDILDELISFGHVWAENYRYHAVKKFRSMDWSKLGRKTLVSNMKKIPVDKDTWEYYKNHFGIGTV